jgi:hypothetical protein
MTGTPERERTKSGRNQPNRLRWDFAACKAQTVALIAGTKAGDRPGTRHIFDEETMNIVPAKKENTSPPAEKTSSRPATTGFLGRTGRSAR